MLTKFLITNLFFILFNASLFAQVSLKRPLFVYFKDHFNGDSVNIKINDHDSVILCLTTDDRIDGVLKGIVVDKDKVKDRLKFIHLRSQTVSYVSIKNSSKYLYVYFEEDKFLFRFEENEIVGE